MGLLRARMFLCMRSLGVGREWHWHTAYYGRANPCTAIARLTDLVFSSRHAVAALPPRHLSSLRVRAPHTIPVVSKHTSVNTMNALALIGGLNDMPDDDMTIREHQITA